MTSPSNIKRISILAFFVLAMLGFESAQAQFITTWNTANPGSSTSTQITIPAVGGPYNVAWVEVGVPANNGSTAGLNGAQTITFPSAGNYRVTITGTLPGFFFNNGGDRLKITAIEQWGPNTWTSLQGSFAGCSNVNITASDVPNLSGVTNLSNMFYSAGSLNANLNGWNVSTITNMSRMFSGADSFNSNLSSWNVSNVTDMSNMFDGAELFNQNINSWNTGSVTNMSGMFAYALSFNQNLNGWNVSNVTNMSSMFTYALSFNGAINAWNVSSVTTMNDMFNSASLFNQDLNTWNTAQVTNMHHMFAYDFAFNGDITAWNVGNVVDMNFMFGQATHFNRNIGGWSVGSVTDMSNMFYYDIDFNQDLNSWDVHQVTNMSGMFWNATSFNIAIGNWDVSSVTNMNYMFLNSFFNQDIGLWNVSNVQTMTGMFFVNHAFNQDISGWNTGNVTDMSYMFDDATFFNQNIGDWDVSKVTTMYSMFFGAVRFNQNLANWDISLVTDMTEIFRNTDLSTANYDHILIGWSALSGAQNGVTFGAQGISYCAGESARAALIAFKGWIISDAGKSCNPFVTTWSTTDGQITIPTGTGAFNYELTWSNMTNAGVGDGSASGLTGNYTITGLTNANIYRIEISGDFPHLFIDGQSAGTEQLKLRSIEQWGNISWESFNNAFAGTSNMVYNATDEPDLSNVTDLRFMFSGSSQFTGDLNNWDVSNVTNMGYMFQQASNFDSPLSNWDVSNVTNMTVMFSGSLFNHDIGSWDVGNNTSFFAMFANTPFNQDIGGWDISGSNTIASMFDGNAAFNQNISSWDVSNVFTMRETFRNASSFNQDLSTWQVGNVTAMDEMFNGSGLSSTNYDNLLIGWASLPSLQGDVTFDAASIPYCLGELARNSIITNYNWTFNDGGKSCAAIFVTTWQTTDDEITIPIGPETSLYNVTWTNLTSPGLGDGSANDITTDYTITSLSNGDIYKVEISGLFPHFRMGGNSTNGSKLLTIESWGTNAWESMEQAFHGSTNLTYNATDIPNLSNVTDMSYMFANCNVFDGDIGGWNTSTVTNMSYLFYGNFDFNQNIGNWDVGNVSDMSFMFNNTYDFDRDLSNWNVGSVFNMQAMFKDAFNFDQDLGDWNVHLVTNMSEMFTGSDLSDTNYDNILIGWAALPSLQGDVTLDAPSTYCLGESARTLIIANYNWTFNDNGKLCPGFPFVTTWSTTDGEITIPTGTGSFNYNLTWVNITNPGVGDGAVSAQNGNYTITGLANGDQYQISIAGQFPHFQMNGNTTEGPKLLTIESWGDIAWQTMHRAFQGCTNLTYNATDTPDLSNVDNLTFMFADCSAFNGAIGNWNTSTIRDMGNLFQSNTVFNQDLNNWDVSHVVDMQSMFSEALAFNQDLDNWDIGNLLIMDQMFSHAIAFNGNIGNWNTGLVISMQNLFARASSFNQDLNSWNVSRVNSMFQTFSSATSFNGNISSWDVSHVDTMQGMFSGTTVFNGDISSWDVSSVTNMSSMFGATSAFNRNLNSWDVSNVTNMAGMFASSLAFNQDLNSWDVSNVTDMRAMFQNSVFNGNISAWNTGSVTHMGAIFYLTTAFNRDITAWNVSNVTNMNAAFLQASSFNQNLAGWNVGQTTTMLNLFNLSGLTDVNYNNILIGWAALPSLQSNVQMDALNNQYCSGASARSSLISTHGWTINDGGSSCIPTITGFLPTSAGPGATVTISGTNFISPTSVRFGGTNATSFTPVSTTTITAIVGVGTSGSVGVITPNGAASLGGFIYTPPPAPTISGFTPTTTGTGTVVTITGTNFTSASAVSFGGTAATSFNVVSSTSIDATVSGGASGNVSVTTPGGTATRAGFIFIPAPTISSFTPISTGSGKTVIITGTNFDGTTSVSFGGTNAISFSIISSTSISAVVGSGTSGNVVVTTPGGTATGGLFNFIPAPTITSFTPTSTGGGTLVTITGTNLSNTTSVDFGGTAALTFSVVSNTSIRAIVATGTSGDISVTTLGGTATKSGFVFAFTPTIISFTPAIAPTGATVTITGTNFSGASAVSFGGTAATSFTIVSATSITAVVASGASGDVAVITPGGTATRAGFSFISSPTITSFSPTRATSGATVSIIGTNLTGATSVSFGGTAATSFSIVSSANILATVGPGASGSVSVTTPAGTITLAGFTFISASNTAPVISTREFSTQVESVLTIGLTDMLHDVDNDIDLSTLRIVSPPISGATANINSSLELQLDYTGIFFSGRDRLILGICDLFGACSQSAITVDVVGDIIVYNGISPNGDGQNDFFKLQYIEMLQETKSNKVSIFNRWGDEVFSTRDYNNTSAVFNGLNTNGAELPSGVYFYKIEFNGDHPAMTGYLSLSR